MRGKKSRRKAKTRTGIVFFIVFCTMLFSLSIRWFGFGRNLNREDKPYQIEVLNGTGENGLAMQTAMKLRKMGIDVLIVGDAERYDFKESLLIDRVDDPALMGKLSRLLGCRRVLIQVQEHPLVDATLIVGEDWEKLNIGGGT